MSTSIDLLAATAEDLQRDLSSGNLTSVELVNACLDQIEQHDDYLHAVISKAPRAHIVEQAQKLDLERKTSRIRSKLHGIPILIKVLPHSHFASTCLIPTYRITLRLCRNSTWTPLLEVLLLLIGSPRGMQRLLNG